MGTARLAAGLGLEPIVDDRFKRSLLRNRRNDVLVGPAPLLPALERAACRVEDDLCVLVRSASRGWMLVAGCVCSPSHWKLSEKVGRPLADVHSVVPGYDSELASRVSALLDRLRPGTVVARRNWSIHETSARYEPSCPPALGVPPAAQWLRSEHQSLRRLPRSGAVLFSIRVDQVRLGDVPAEVRHRIGARLAAEPGPLIAYRNLQHRRAPLLDYLLADGG